MGALKDEVEELKGGGLEKAVEKVMEGKWPALGNSAGATVASTRTVPITTSAGNLNGRPSKFKPTEVRVQGFYDYATGQGEMSAVQVEDLAGKLLEGVPELLKKKFEVKMQYKQSRRITFVCDEGGECCWELREKLTDVMSARSS